MSFHFKQFSIIQQTEGLKVNTDGCLLGALSNFAKPLRCLDIGTGTGVIAMMLAQKHPESLITAMELNMQAYLQAKRNIEASCFKQQIDLIQGDLLEYSWDTKFDLIVCNPPYFSKHLKGPDKDKNMALHNDSLPQDQLIEKVSALLSPDGLFMVIYPPYEMQLMENLAIKNNLHIANKYRIDNRAGNPYRNILGFTKNKTTTIEETIVLMNAEGKRTAQFSKIMEEFYL